MAARYSNATIVILQQLYGDTVVDTDGYGSVRRSCRYSGADLTDLGSLGGSFLFFDWPSPCMEDLRNAIG